MADLDIAAGTLRKRVYNNDLESDLYCFLKW